MSINTHEKTLIIINAFGMSAEKVAEVIKKAQTTVYFKLKQRKYNKFTEEDFLRLKTYCLDQMPMIEELN